MRSLLLSFAAAALVTVLAPTEAHAESAPAPPRCSVGIKPDGKAPANIPALVVVDRSSPGLTATIQLTANEVKPAVDLDVVPDPRTPGVTLLVPKTKAPLSVGATYSITYDIACSNPGGLSDKEGGASFVANAEVPLPTTIGTVRELADGRAVITPSAELAAYMQTTRFDAVLDGVSVGSTRYGDAVGAELSVVLGSGYVYVGSGVTTGGSSSTLCAGGKTTGVEKHVVQLTAHVAGAETDPAPLDLSLSIDCSASPSSVLPDGGGDDRGATGDLDPSFNVPSKSSGGCTVSSGGSLGGIGMLCAAFGTVAVMLRRRRRP